MYRAYFPKVDAFHAVSQAMAKEAESYGALCKKIDVVYSGLDVRTFKPIQKSLSEGYRNDRFSILSVGRPHWIKGYVYALDACKILKDLGFQFHYTIIGAANTIELEYQIHDLNLQDQVTLMGSQSFEDVQKAINASDLLLLPSTKEGIANVVLEAMAMKTLILSSNCGGIEEIIVDSSNGFLVPIRDSILMAEKIMLIAGLPNNKKIKIIEAAYQTILKNHLEHQMIDKMIDLYDKALKQTEELNLKY